MRWKRLCKNERKFATQDIKNWFGRDLGKKLKHWKNVRGKLLKKYYEKFHKLFRIKTEAEDRDLPLR